MLEKISQADMEEGEGQDLATTVLTCEGDLHDPGFPGRLQSLVLRLRELISDEEQPLWVKKVEPWNSVRVTFTLPRDAALRLRQLAQRGDRALRELGILSVQVEGDQIISLTLAGRYGEPPKEIIIQKAAEEGSEQGSQASPHVPGGPSSSSPALSAAASSRAGSSSATTTPAEPPSIQARSPAFAAAAATSTSGSSGSAFRSPNVVAPPPREPLPFLSSGSSRLVRPSAKTRPPFPFASMTHSMKQNSAAAAAAAAATTTSGSRFPFSPSPPLAAALGAAQRLGNATRGNVALSSPLLVNLLQSETGSSGPQKTMMPPPLDTGQPTKRKRRPTKSSRGKEGCSPPGSPASPPPMSPSCDIANVLGSRSYPLSSHIPSSPPRAAPPTATVSVAPPSPPAAVESRTTTHLINPFTGHLEPMPSDEEDDEPAVRDLETSESSENGGHSERSLSDGSSGGKDPGNPSSDTDSGIGKSSSSQSSNDPEPPIREEVSRVSLPPTEGEKLKLRLKLDSKRTCPVKTEIEASSPPSPQGEPPRVPPLHISLRGPNVAVVVSPRKPEAVPKKRPPRSPRSSNGAESGGGGNDVRRGYRGARARADKGAERTRELSLLSGGGIVRVPVSMSPTVVLTPLQLQHPMGASSTRRTLPSPSSSSSSPSSSSPSSASSSCAQSTKPHWSATSLGPEADSSVSDGSSPLRDRPDLPHALRSADNDSVAATSATTMTVATTVAIPPRQAGNNEPATNSALGALECHTTPHRTTPRPRSVPTPETNGVLHTDEEEQRSPSPCRASPSSLAKTMTTVAMTSAIEKKPLTNCVDGPIANHIGSTKGDGVDELREMAERRLSPTPMARIISLDAVATKKATFGGPVFEVSDVDAPAALKLGGLVGGNHRMPLLISTGGGGGTFRGDVMLRQEYAAATHHHPHHHFHCTTANSVLKPGIVRMNRLRFGAGFAATTAASAVPATGTLQPRVEALASSVAAKTNGIASSSPLQNECDSTIDAESSLDSDDLVPNGPSTTSLVAAASRSASATSQTLSAASAIVSRSDGFSELPLSRGLCDSATNGSADFVAVVGSDNGVTTTGRAEENGEGVSPDSNHEPLRDLLGPSDTDGDKSGDEEEASSALSEERGSSVSPPSEDPCSNIPPDRPSSASLPPAAPSPLSPPLSSSPGTTAVVVASSQSMATPSEAVVTPSLTAEAAVVASSTSSCSSSFTLPSSSCSSSTTWDSSRPTTISGMAEVMPRTQPQPTCSLADVPSSTLQVPGGQMISPSMWSTAGSSSSSSSGGASNDPQQRLTFIFKGNLTASTTASSSSSTSGHPVLALPASSGSGGPKPVPIKLLALPSGASGLALNSSLAELISSPATQGGSSRLAATRSVSPPIRLVVSKMASTGKGAGNTTRAVHSPTGTSLLTSSPSLANMVMKSVMSTAVTTTTTVVPSPVVTTGAEATLPLMSSGTAPLSVNVSLPVLPEERQPVVSGVCESPGEAEVPIKPDSREATCAMAGTSSVVVTEADTRGGVAAALSAEVVPMTLSEAGSNGKGECGGAEKGPLSAERLASPTLLSGVCADLAEDGELAVLSPSVIANHIGSPQLPDSLSTLLDMAIDPPDDDDDDESELASNRDSPLAVSLLLTNHKDSEEEPHMREHEADLELLRTCPEASVVCVPGDELGDDGRLRNQRRRAAQGEEGESDHSSEEEMSLSELAHKSRVRPSRPQRHGKENEVLAAAVAAADSPAPSTRREDGGPGRPRRLTAAGSGESKAVRSRLGQQQAMASQLAQALLSPSPVAAATIPAEEALRRNADRSRRSPATMPVGRDHRSPPRLPNQRNFRRDSEVRDDDAVVVMKRKTRASGPSTDPQQEAAAPNKRRRYSKDSHR